MSQSQSQTLIPEQNVDFNHELTQGFASKYIRRKAKELARGPRFRGIDPDDLRQQLYVRVLERLPQFDPNQGCFNAFVKLIVKQFAIDSRRHVRRQMRDRQNDVSLSSLVEGEEGPVELTQTIGRRELNARLSREERTAEETSDLKQDVQTFLASLPPRLRTIAERAKDLSPTQIAQELGVHYTTVYRGMQQLRKRFAKAGFGEYWNSMQGLRSRRRSSTNSDPTFKTSPPNVNPYWAAEVSRTITEEELKNHGTAASQQATNSIGSSITHESAEDYHAKAGEFLTSHLLADFRRCPLLYHRKRQGLVPVGEECPAFLVGSAAHTVILEGEDVFRRRFAVGGPVNPKTGLPFGVGTKASAEWAKAHGRQILTLEQSTTVANMALSVAQHREAWSLFAQGEAECVVRCDYYDVPCQIRMDWLEPHLGIVDLKTCDDLTWFEADARRYGYVYQMAFYRAVLAQVIGLYVPVHFIAVEKKEPFRCGVWRLSQEVLATAQKDNESAIDRLKVCLSSDSWSTGYEEARTFDYL